MRILPRRHLIHPTVQPIHSAMKHKHNHKRINVTVPSYASAVSEYREAAKLLRSLGLDLAATLLSRTADRLDPPPAQEELVVPRTDTKPETVVVDVDTLNQECP